MRDDRGEGGTGGGELAGEVMAVEGPAGEHYAHFGEEGLDVFNID